MRRISEILHFVQDDTRKRKTGPFLVRWGGQSSAPARPQVEVIQGEDLKNAIPKPVGVPALE